MVNLGKSKENLKYGSPLFPPSSEFSKPLIMPLFTHFYEPAPIFGK